MKTDFLFFTGINQVSLTKTSVNGERFLDRFHITNDQKKISQLIGPLRTGVGSVEYTYLITKCPALIYSTYREEIDGLDVGSLDMESKIVRDLASVQGLLQGLWIVRDHAAYQDRGWLVATFAGQSVFHTNNWNVRHSTSNGKYDCVSFTLEQLKIARLLADGGIQSLSASGHPTALINTTSRFQRFTYFVEIARSSADVAMKIAQYCSALEALVSSSSSELTHQVAERVACLLESPGKTRLDRFKKIKDAYGFRSRAVHGSSFKVKVFDELRQISTDIDEVCRKIAEMYYLDLDGIRDRLEGTEEEFNAFFFEKLFFYSGS